MTTHTHSRGRRFFVGIGVTALTLLGGTANASAEDNYPCDFPLEFEVLTNKVTERTFTRDGVVTVRYTGALTVRLTNGDTGESIVRNISGPVTLTFNPDGTITQVANGPSFTILEPDIEPLDLPRGLITRGRVVSQFETPNFEGFSIVSQTGNVEDVCAALS